VGRFTIIFIFANIIREVKSTETEGAKNALTEETRNVQRQYSRIRKAWRDENT